MPQPPAPPRRCPTCGAANQAFATFCYDCGEPLDQAALPTKAGIAAPVAVPRAWRWEVGVALVLIVGVLGYAVFDWGQREQQAQLYRSGVAAAAAHHWDAAANAFAALGTYRDSVKRRQETAQAILIRDSSYIAGNEAAAWKDWITAYSALSQTVAIEADYRNAQALFDTATREAPRQALADTILRRPDGTPPGLYVRRADGSETWLKGSDAYSAVWATDSGPGRVLYDSPDRAQPPVPPPDQPFTSIRQLPPQRYLQVADGRAAAQPPVRLPDVFGSGGIVMLGPQGVWSLNLSRDDQGNYSEGQGNYRRPLLAFPLDSISYYDLQSGVGSTLALTGTGTYLLDMSLVQQQVLVGQYTPQDVKLPHTRVFLLAGSGLQPVEDIAGFVQEAELSPDGHGALYNVGGPATHRDPLDVQLLWDDLTHPTLPATPVFSQTYGVSPPDGDWLRGQLVPGPPPRVLLHKGLDPSGPIRLRDIQSGQEQVLWHAPGRVAIAKYWVSPDGETLFLEERAGDDFSNSTLIIQPLDPVRPPTRVQLPPAAGTNQLLLLDAQLLPGRLVCRLAYIPEQQAGSSTQTFVERLYSFSPTDPRAPPLLLGEQPVANSDVVQGTEPQLLLLSDKVVGVLSPDGFLLRTPDGLATLPPVPGISAVWTFQPPPRLLIWGR